MNIPDCMISSLGETEKKILAKLLFGVDISELYSPVRINQLAHKFGLLPGTSFDLTDGWDFNRKDHRDLAWRRITDEDPWLIIGSPPAPMFPTLQNLNIGSVQ